MRIAHEIGHNFNLRHPFDVGEDKGDLKLHQGQTLENIMDYLPDAEKTYKSFITYQWERMRNYLHSNKNTIEELGLKISEDALGNDFLYLEDFSNSVINRDKSNLSAFSNDSLKAIVNGNYLYHNKSTIVADLLINLAFQQKMLVIFIKFIRDKINELCN